MEPAHLVAIFPGGVDVLAQPAKPPPRIPLGSFLGRILSLALWRSADPGSLPVASPAALDIADKGSPGVGAVHPARRAVLLLAAAAAVATLAIIVTGSLVWRDAIRLTWVFANPEDAVSFSETIWALEDAAEDHWWTGFVPGTDERFTVAAEAVRAGGDDLLALARTYESSRDAINNAGVPGRLLLGGKLLNGVFAAAGRVSRPWHRQSLTYQEIALYLDPYSESAGMARTSVGGRLVQSPPGVGLVLAVHGPSGRLMTTTDNLGEGDEFQIPLAVTYTVTATAWRRSPEGQRELAGRKTFPLTSWPDGPIVFPDPDLRFRVAFDTEAVARTPELPPISSTAMNQLEQ